MRILLPLLISIALPVMAAPKYKIQARNQSRDVSSIKPSITFLLPQDLHRPKRLNQGSNTGVLMRTETSWTSIARNLLFNINRPHHYLVD